MEAPDTKPAWDDWFMGMCFWVSLRSPDPSTKHGAVLVDLKHHILGIGYNGFPRGCDGLPVTRDPKNGVSKYDVMIHAEENCLLNSSNLLLNNNCTMYITGFPCPNCFSKIIQTGIDRVVYGPVSSSSSSVYSIRGKIDIVWEMASQRNIQVERWIEGKGFRRNIDLFEEITTLPPNTITGGCFNGAEGCP